MPSQDESIQPLRLNGADRKVLRTLTFNAVAECMGRLKALHDEGHKFERHSYPVRDVDAQGTYSTVEWSSSKAVPLSYRSAIGPSGTYRAAISYSDISGFEALLEFVRERPRLRSWLIPDDFGDAEWREHIRAVGVTGLPLHIVDRHIHAAGWEIDHEVVEHLYNEMEAWWLNEDLPVDLWVPILGISFDADEVLLDDGARLVRLSDKEQLARWPSQRLDDQAAYVAMATHALVMSGWTMKNHQALQWFSPTNPPESIPTAERFLEALAVVSHEASGYVQAVIKPVDWAPGYSADLPVMLTGSLIPDRKSIRLRPSSEPSVTLAPERIETLRATYNALTQHGDVALAATRLLSSERRVAEADRIVDLCVGLEALLSDSQGETTYKIALRSVAMLAERGTPEPSRFLAPLKKVYAHRSSVVHGRGSARTSTVSLGDETVRTELVAHMVLRLLLEARIENPALTPAAIDELIVGKALDLYSRRNEDESTLSS